MKLYSQMGVSSRRNSPYFLYRSYVTWCTGQPSACQGGRRRACACSTPHEAWCDSYVGKSYPLRGSGAGEGRKERRSLCCAARDTGTQARAL